MVLLVRCRPCRLELCLANHVRHVAVLAEVEIEAIVALPAYSDDRHFLTSTALYELPDVLPWFYYHLDLMALWVVPTYFDSFLIACEEAVLAHAVVLAVAADEERADDWAHEAIHALAVAVGGQAVPKLRDLEALEFMTWTQSVVH